MKHNYRWTVRNLDPGALQVLHEAQELNPDRTLGSLVSEAVLDWWENLPDNESDMNAGFEGISNPDI
ncbi:MAG: hypothetical protein ACC644_04965 [Candidatus Hydrothermarchaeales archaeon]